MIKAIVCDLLNVLIFQAANVGSYDPLSFNSSTSLIFNDELLDDISNLNVKKVVFTSMNKVTLDFELMSKLSASGFDVIEANQLGLDKSSGYAYEYLVRNKLGLKMDEIVFVDDSMNNITAAKNQGISTFHFDTGNGLPKANLELRKVLKSLDIS